MDRACSPYTARKEKLKQNAKLSIAYLNNEKPTVFIKFKILTQSSLAQMLTTLRFEGGMDTHTHTTQSLNITSGPEVATSLYYYQLFASSLKLFLLNCNY